MGAPDPRRMPPGAPPTGYAPNGYAPDGYPPNGYPPNGYRGAPGPGPRRPGPARPMQPRSVPRSAGRRPGAARSHQRSRLNGRTVAIVGVGLAVVVGGWYLFLRGGGGPATGAFMKAETVYLEAARSVPVAAGGVHRQADVEAFDAVAIDSAIKMNNQVQVFKRLARDEEGASAELARDAARAGAAGVKAVADFRDALAANKVADAVGANGKLQSSIADIEQTAKQWRRL